MSALIQNFDTVEKVIETSANSAGSALKENERYLDSIQGKIDQFNNAMQAMWSNTLESDAVKNIVALGTELIKIIDKLGLLNIAIAGLAAFLNKKYNFVDFGNLFTGFKETFSNSKGAKDFFKTIIGGFKNTEISIEKAKEKLAELEEQKAKLGDPKSEKNRRKVDILDQEINKYKEMLAPSEALIAAQNKLQQAQNRLANTKSTNPKTIQKYQREVNKAKLEVDNLTVAQKKSGKTGNTAFTGLGKSVKKFGKQVASVITQMLVMWAITKVIELLAKGFDNLIPTAEEAAEAYEELNSELDTLKGNIEDINDELSTLDDKMAELTAKDSLTFTEKEELERLRAEREELERTLELNQQLANQKQHQVNNQTSDQVEYYRNKGVKSGKTTGETTGSAAVSGTAIGGGLAAGVLAATGGGAAIAAKIGAAIGTTIAPGVGTAIGIALGALVGATVGAIGGLVAGSSEEKVGDSIENMEEKLAEKEEAVEKAREKYQKSGSDKDKEKYEKAQQALSDYRGEMAQYFADIDAMYQNVDLSTIEDPDEYKRLKEEMNDFYNERDKWLITSGAEGAESNAIERIFSKEDYEDASKTVDNLVKKLEKDPTDQNAINKISELCNIAEKDLEAVGLSVQDAKDYFTMLGQNAAFDTMEGKINEVTLATSKLQTLLSNTNSTDFTGLFGQGGEVSATAIAEYFQGTSEATREEIAKIVKAVNESEISVDTALKQFELFTVQSVVDIQIKEVQTNFKDVFTDLEDADGLIDTFEELGEAIGSTVGALDALNKAQGEMDYSGRVSIQTALELMQYTDNYADVLEVVDGKLQLNKNAEENLINARINAMKVSAQTALADAQAAYEKAKLATQTYNDALTTDMSASVVAKAWEKVLAAGAGLVEGIKSLFGKESWTEAYNRAYNETLSNMTGYETTYDDAGLQALKEAEAEAEQAVKNAQGNVDLLDNLNADNIKEMYESDDIEDPEDAAKTKLEEKMEEFQRAMDYWENRIAANQARYEQLQNEIDLLEAKGQKADASYYEEQIELENERLWLLEQQKAEAQKYLQEIESTAGIGSEEWWEIANVLNDIESELDDVTASIVDLQDAIGEIDTYKFEEFNTRLDNLVSKLETIRDLIAPDEDAWFDDQGQWTEEGVAVLGTYIQELETYKQGLEETQEAYADYVKEYAGNEKYYAKLGIHSEQELYDKREELIQQQYDYMESINDTEQSVVDMYESNIDAVEEYTETLIDSYNDYIDSVKEALDAERD